MPTEGKKNTRFLFIKKFDPAEVLKAVRNWREKFSQPGVLALLPETEQEYIGPLQDLFSELGVPLIGAVFPVLLAEGKFQSKGVLLVRFDEMPEYRVYDRPALP